MNLIIKVWRQLSATGALIHDIVCQQVFMFVELTVSTTRFRGTIKASRTTFASYFCTRASFHDWMPRSMANVILSKQTWRRGAKKGSYPSTPF